MDSNWDEIGDERNLAMATGDSPSTANAGSRSAAGVRCSLQIRLICHSSAIRVIYYVHLHLQACMAPFFAIPRIVVRWSQSSRP